MITSPQMGLKIWNLTTDPYDSGQLADNWAKVDQHDHSPGKGIQIPTSGLKDGSVTQNKIAAGVTLPTAMIPSGTVTTVEIQDGTIQAIDLADGSVTNPKIGNNAVGTSKLLDGSVTTPKLADGAITTSKLLDGLVTTPKLTDGAITIPKLQTGTVLELNVGGTRRKVAFGTSSWGFPGFQPTHDQVTINHGLAATPVWVGLTVDHIPGQVFQIIGTTSNVNGTSFIAHGDSSEAEHWVGAAIAFTWMAIG